MPTTYYCYHGGDNSDGLAWATAKQTLDAAHALCVAGDTLLVAADHAETFGGTTTLSEGTGGGAPIYCYTVNRGTGNLQTMDAGGGLITCSTYVVVFTSPCAYYYGLKFTSTNTGNAYSVLNAQTAGAIKFDTCIFTTTSTNAGVRVPYLGSLSQIDDLYIELDNCTFKYGATTQRMSIAGGRILLQRCTVDGTGSIPATWILPLNQGAGDVCIRDCNLSALTGNLVDASIATYTKVRFSHCSLGSGWVATTGAIPGYGGVEVYVEACDTADTYIRHQKTSYAGNLIQDTSVYRTGGSSTPSSDTATDPLPYSWKVTTNASNYFVFPFTLPPIYQYYEGVIDGTTKTVTVCYTQDNETNLNDDEIWMEVEYMATDGSVLATVDRDDRKADIKASAAGQTDDASGWEGDDAWSNANPQKMTATIAPREKGYLIVRIYVAKASVSAAPIYIDPLVTVS